MAKIKDQKKPASAVVKAPPPKSAVQVSDLDSEMELDAGAGSEGVTPSDFAIPFLMMLQSGSPQCKKGDPARIEGAQEGHIMDTVTNVLYEEVRVIPCAYKRQLNKWVPRDDGGGFRGVVPWNESLAAEARQEGYRTEDGYILKDTAQWFVLYEDEENEWRPAVIGLSSTQLTKSRKWMSLIRSIKKTGKHGVYNPPMFSHIFLASSKQQSNDKGSWSVFDFTIDDEIKDIELYRTAKLFYESVVGGGVKVQDPPSDGPSHSIDEDADSAF